MTTYPRPVLTERQRDLLTSLGLGHQLTDLAIIILHRDDTISRVDAGNLDTWLDGYSQGRSARP